MFFHGKIFILGKYLYASHTLFILYLEGNHTLFGENLCFICKFSTGNTDDGNAALIAVRSRLGGVITECNLFKSNMRLQIWHDYFTKIV